MLDISTELAPSLGTLHVRLRGNFSDPYLGNVKELFQEWFDKNISYFIVDFREVFYLEGEGLVAFLDIVLEAEKNKVSIIFFGCSNETKLLFNFIGVRKSLICFDKFTDVIQYIENSNKSSATEEKFKTSSDKDEKGSEYLRECEKCKSTISIPGLGTYMCPCCSYKFSVKSLVEPSPYLFS